MDPLQETKSIAAEEGRDILPNLMNNLSEIANFFNGRSIFITGATGFIGKALLEKLLRCCLTLKTVYILVRPKKEADVQSRIHKLLEDPLFDTIKMTHPKSLQKIIAVRGDIGLPSLGLSIQDIQAMAESVSVVFHSAATINFNEKLKVALNLNVGGTQRVMELCKQMRNFGVLVHVSTAYANCNRSIINEVVYPLASNYVRLSEKLAKMTDEEIETLTSRLVENRPNTYTYTKAMGESILNEASSEIPICIIRPSITTGIWKEPLHGWVDGALGIAGLFALWGKGIIRTLRVNGDNVADFIPVDTVVNLMLASAREMGTSPAKHLRVYNCCSGEQNKITWNEGKRLWNKIVVDNPFNGAIWYPECHYSSNTFQHQILHFLYHYLPAVAMDIGEMLTCRRRKTLRIHHKITKLTTAMHLFMTNEWTFTMKNTRDLECRLSAEDKTLFQLNIRDLDWAEYAADYCAGIGRYILKETNESAPASRKRIQKLYWIRTSLRLLPVILIIGVILYLIVYYTTS